MTQIVQIQPPVALIVQGGSKITLNQMQAFIDSAHAMGVPMTKELSTEIAAPYHYDQRDHSPGSFTITASP